MNFTTINVGKYYYVRFGDSYLPETKTESKKEALSTALELSAQAHMQAIQDIRKQWMDINTNEDDSDVEFLKDVWRYRLGNWPGLTDKELQELPDEYR